MNSQPKKRLHVLVVENNPVDMKMLTGMLDRAVYGSFTYKTADTISGALQLLEQEPFEIVLLDLNLTDSKGLDTLKRLSKKFPEIPIVVNTGAYEDDLGLKAVTIGAQDYLIKGKYQAYVLSKSLYYAVERKKAEQEVKSAYIRLKETQAQLIQVEKMNVVGGLASGVAHEVKNPLATILYGVEFLNTKLKTTDDPQVRLTLDSIKDATKKANEIIKDLLDFASLSRLKITPADINAVIEQALHLTWHQCEKQNIRVVRELMSPLPAIMMDVNRIEQVVVDLILNALLAMKEGGVLTVRTRSADLTEEEALQLNHYGGVLTAGEPVVVVEVDDTGYGIDEDFLDKIFDPFFTTRRAAGGVGLGLSIAQTIMANHKGAIHVSNRRGMGARATLVFKLTDESDGDEEKENTDH